MIKITESKPSTPKKTVTVSNVTIKNGVLIDEDGEIVDKLQEHVKDNEFTIKISLPIEDNEGIE